MEVMPVSKWINTLLLLFACSLAHGDIAGRIVAATDGDTIKK